MKKLITLLGLIMISAASAQGVRTLEVQKVNELSGSGLTTKIAVWDSTSLGFVAKYVKLADLPISTDLSNYVDKSSNESIGGVKTFSNEIIGDAGMRLNSTLNAAGSDIINVAVISGFSGNFSTVSVTDDAYGVGWNGDFSVPTKNAVYDRIESLSFTDNNDFVTSGALVAEELQLTVPNNSRVDIDFSDFALDSDLDDYVTIATNQTITGSKTYTNILDVFGGNLILPDEVHTRTLGVDRLTFRRTNSNIEIGAIETSTNQGLGLYSNAKLMADYDRFGINYWSNGNYNIRLDDDNNDTNASWKLIGNNGATYDIAEFFENGEARFSATEITDVYANAKNAVTYEALQDYVSSNAASDGNDFVTSGALVAEELQLTVPNNSRVDIDFSDFALDSDIFSGDYNDLINTPNQDLSYVIVTDSIYTMQSADVLDMKPFYIEAYRADGTTKADTVVITYPRINPNGSAIVSTFNSISGSVIKVVPDSAVVDRRSQTQKSYTSLRPNDKDYLSLTMLSENEIFSTSDDWRTEDYTAPAAPGGGNLILNGTFNDSSNLTLQNGWSIVGGEASFDDSITLVQLQFDLSEPMVDGDSYTLTLDVSSSGNARIRPEVEDSNGTNYEPDVLSYENYTTQTGLQLTFTFTTGSAFDLDTFIIEASGSGDAFTIDNVQLVKN